MTSLPQHLAWAVDRLDERMAIFLEGVHLEDETDRRRLSVLSELADEVLLPVRQYLSAAAQRERWLSDRLAVRDKEVADQEQELREMRAMLEGIRLESNRMVRAVIEASAAVRSIPKADGQICLSEPEGIG